MPQQTHRHAPDSPIGSGVTPDDGQLLPTRELVGLVSELETALRDWRNAPLGMRSLAAQRLRRAGRDLYDALRRAQKR